MCMCVSVACLRACVWLLSQIICHYCTMKRYGTYRWQGTDTYWHHVYPHSQKNWVTPSCVQSSLSATVTVDIEGTVWVEFRHGLDHWPSCAPSQSYFLQTCSMRVARNTSVDEKTKDDFWFKQDLIRKEIRYKYEWERQQACSLFKRYIDWELKALSATKVTSRRRLKEVINGHGYRGTSTTNFNSS